MVTEGKKVDAGRASGQNRPVTATLLLRGTDSASHRGTHCRCVSPANQAASLQCSTPNHHNCLSMWSRRARFPSPCRCRCRSSSCASRGRSWRSIASCDSRWCARPGTISISRFQGPGKELARNRAVLRISKCRCIECTPKPIDVPWPRAEMIFSRPEKAPPQTNKMFVVSTWMNSC
jgi:hypothetical protein